MARESTPARQEAAPPARSRRDFLTLLETHKEDFTKIVPRMMQKLLTPDRIVSLAINAFQKSKQLRECDPMSILDSIATAVKLGFEPNGPLGHCYLIPYWDDKLKVNVCQCQISYKGFNELARRTRMYQAIDSRLIHERDAFSIRYRPAPDFDHVPCLDGDPGKIVGAYAYAYLKGSSIPVFELMMVPELEAIRAMSKASNSPAWRNWRGEMYKKTAMKRMLKDQPMDIHLADAIDHDNDLFGVDLSARPKLQGGTEGLMRRLEGAPAGEPVDESEHELMDKLAEEETVPT